MSTADPIKPLLTAEPQTEIALAAAKVLSLAVNLVEVRQTTDGRAALYGEELADILLGAVVMLHANLGREGRDGLEADIRRMLLFLYSPGGPSP